MIRCFKIFVSRICWYMPLHACLQATRSIQSHYLQFFGAQVWHASRRAWFILWTQFWRGLDWFHSVWNILDYNQYRHLSPRRHYLTRVLSLKYVLFNKATWWLRHNFRCCKLQREAQHPCGSWPSWEWIVLVHHRPLHQPSHDDNAMRSTFQITSCLFMLFARAKYVCTIRYARNATQ